MATAVQWQVSRKSQELFTPCQGGYAPYNSPEAPVRNGGGFLRLEWAGALLPASGGLQHSPRSPIPYSNVSATVSGLRPSSLPARIAHPFTDGAFKTEGHRIRPHRRSITVRWVNLGDCLSVFHSERENSTGDGRAQSVLPIQRPSWLRWRRGRPCDTGLDERRQCASTGRRWGHCGPCRSPSHGFYELFVCHGFTIARRAARDSSVRFSPPDIVASAVFFSAPVSRSIFAFRM